MAEPLVLSFRDSQEEAKKKILDHMAAVEKERMAERADAEREAEAIRVVHESAFTSVDEGRQYSIHALAKLGRAGVEDVICTAIARQVPGSVRKGPAFARYEKELIQATHELVGMYAKGSNNRGRIGQAAGKVSYAAGMCQVRPPVKGIEVHGQTEW